LGSLLFQSENPVDEPVADPFQKIVPVSGPVTHFHTPSVSASLPPIHPAPATVHPQFSPHQQRLVSLSNLVNRSNYWFLWHFGIIPGNA
jgi:hypothetical protein